MLRIGGSYFSISLAARLALLASELEPFLPFFVPPEPLLFAAFHGPFDFFP